MDLALRKAQEDCTESYLLNEGLKLERELNAANEMFRKLNLHTLNLTDRIKRLEEALEATAKVIGPPGKSTWVSDDELNHAWELYIKAKEAKL
jgi:predicted nuclease with TOPRIM domain